MTLRDLSAAHLHALDTTAALAGWTARPRERHLDTAEVDRIAEAAGRAVLARLRAWEAQQEVTDALAAVTTAERRVHVASRRATQTPDPLPGDIAR